MTTYTTGTISVGAGSTSVTGVATAWLTSGIRAGDLLICAGDVVPITSINSATGITLARAWPGAAQAGANYHILLIDDNARSLVAANQLLQQLTGTGLPLIAALQPAADRLPYFTGPGAAALATFTASARALLDDPDFATMRATLGLVLTTSAQDTTAGRTTKVGDYGWPYAILLTASDNLNNILISGNYVNRVPADAIGNNYPGNGVGYLLHQQDARPDRGVQTFISYTDSAIYVRARTAPSGVWTAWRRLDAERGSNANGEYVRLPDGTQICWARRVQTALALGSAFHGGCRANFEAWSFPATFSSPPEVIATPLLGSAFGTVINSPTVSSVGFSPTSVAASAAADRTTSLMAVGRWQ